MSNKRQAVEELLEDSEFTIEELYVHIPSSGKIMGPHIELSADFSHERISRNLNSDIMEYVETEGLQPATKHQLTNLL